MPLDDVQQLIEDLGRTGKAMGQIAEDDDRFRAALDAYRAEDGESFRRLLNEFGLGGDCEWVCRWFRAKECLILCLELAGPLPEKPFSLEEIPRFAEIVAKVSADEELVERLADSIQNRDREAFQRLVKDLDLERFAHLLCHWACSVRCGLTCDVVCSPSPIARRNFAAELTSAGSAIGRLVENRDALSAVIKGAVALDCESVSAIVGRRGDCEYICRWICSWRCVLVCRRLCPDLPRPIESPIEEMRAFAQAVGRLVRTEGALRRLIEAVVAEDEETFATLVKELELERFCHQLCHWICYEACRRFCICVCPDPRWNPWFTHVGNFAIYANINAGTGRTSVGLSGYSSLYYHGGPDFGFFGCLELRGFCPTTSPTFPGTPMRYRFLYEYPAGNRVAITGNLVCSVTVGSRFITWPDPTGTFYQPTLQTIRVAGSGATPGVPAAPPLGAPPPPVPDHVIVPDVDGWIAVDPLTLDGGFAGPLVGFDTSQSFPGGLATAAGATAGQAIGAADQKNGVVASIIFEATRTGLPPGLPDFTNSLPKIHINNWSSVSLLNLLQFHTGGGTPCSPLSTDLDIEYTTDHELMAAWSVDVTSAAAFAWGPAPSDSLVADPPPSVMTTGPRGGFGTHHENITGWPSCSYLVHLYTRRRLTTGIIDDTTAEGLLSFCK